MPRGSKLLDGPLGDGFFEMVAGRASPVWDVRLSSLSPGGWMREMLPLALSMPAAVQAAAVNFGGVGPGGDCVVALHMASEQGSLWPLHLTAGAWLRAGPTAVAHFMALWGSVLADELLERAQQLGVPVSLWDGVDTDGESDSRQTQELRALCVMLDCVRLQRFRRACAQPGVKRAYWLLRAYLRGWRKSVVAAQQAAVALESLRASRSQLLGTAATGAMQRARSGAQQRTRSKAKSASANHKNTAQRRTERWARQLASLAEGQASLSRQRRRQGGQHDRQVALRPGPQGRERLVLLWRWWRRHMVVVSMRRTVSRLKCGGSLRLADEGEFLSAVRKALVDERWGIPTAVATESTAVEFYHPESANSGHVHVCTALLEGVVDADIPSKFHWSAGTPAISTSEAQLEWVVYDVQLPSPAVSFLGSPVGVVVRMRLQVVAMEHFGARVGQLTTRGPPFAGRLDVDGLVWDRSATKVARSTSLADERALLRQIDAYVGSGGSEWAGSDTDSDDDFCSPSEGGSGDDYGAGDYL